MKAQSACRRPLLVLLFVTLRSLPTSSLNRPFVAYDPRQPVELLDGTFRKFEVVQVLGIHSEQSRLLVQCAPESDPLLAHTHAAFVDVRQCRRYRANALAEPAGQHERFAGFGLTARQAEHGLFTAALGTNHHLSEAYRFPPGAVLS